jgi:hypothetical protein
MIAPRRGNEEPCGAWSFTKSGLIGLVRERLLALATGDGHHFVIGLRSISMVPVVARAREGGQWFFSRRGEEASRLMPHSQDLKRALRLDP